MDIAGPNGEYASMTESTEPSTTKNDYFAKILFGVFCFGLFLMFNHAIFWPENCRPTRAQNGINGETGSWRMNYTRYGYGNSESRKKLEPVTRLSGKI